MDLAGAPIGAVCEADGDHFRYARTMGLDPSVAGVFNSGVLLVDLGAVRRDGSFDRALAMSLENRLPCGDQDALNIVFWGRWKSLPLRWNVQRTMTLPGMRMPDMARQSIPSDRSLRPAIVHFTGPEKPWLRDAYHRYAWLYWRHLASTPFLGRVWAASGIGWAQQLKSLIRFLAYWPFVLPQTAPPPSRQEPVESSAVCIGLAG
jgi:lipopolysaccharide biosynthesis glycosyltransferase